MIKTTTKLALLAASAALFAAPAIADTSEKDWHFGDGVTPERWSLENRDYALCDAGLSQSPIDLGAANAVGDVAVSTSYAATTGKLKLGTEKVQVDFPAGMTMNSGGKVFNLIQVHFHTPAEHAIDGKRHPLVAHFVHATEAGELGVLGVMFGEGAANSELDKVIAALDAGEGADVGIDARRMVPAGFKTYRYMGSLTTPPCSEGVNWHVAKQTLTASAAQIAALNAKLGPSARSIQPLGDRLLIEPAN